MRGVILGCVSDASQRKLRQLRQGQIHGRRCQTSVASILLTAGQPFDFGDPELNRQAAYQQVWVHEMQAGLALLSTRGRQIVVPNANHGTIPQGQTVSAIHEVRNTGPRRSHRPLSGTRPAPGTASTIGNLSPRPAVV